MPPAALSSSTEPGSPAAAFKAFLGPLYRIKWHVYAKRPFAGPDQVLSYLARYTHRVAISNSRLIDAKRGVRFKFKDYRIEGPGRYKTMTLEPAEFIRRFLLHVLPKGFHRIRHYGLLASSRTKAETLAQARELIAQRRRCDLATGGRRQTIARYGQRSRRILARAVAHPWSSSRPSRPAARRSSPTLMPVAIRIDTS